jgi:septum formation protein
VELCGYEVSRCKARRLSNEELETIAGKHLDKAGGYAVQDDDDVLIEKIVGHYDNVVGLPVALVKKLLNKAGIL